MRRSRRAGRAAGAERHRLRARPAQPALDVARGAPARSRRQHHLLLQGGRSAALPAVADGKSDLSTETSVGRYWRPSPMRLHRLRLACRGVVPSSSSSISRSRSPGVDEAGCAPLAGPVVAAACILDRDKFPRGIDDSQESADRKARGALRQAGEMRGAWGVGIASGRGDRPDQHLLGADAGDDPRGRSARAGAGLGAGRRQRLPEMAAAVEGDRRR